MKLRSRHTPASATVGASRPARRTAASGIGGTKRTHTAGGGPRAGAVVPSCAVTRRSGCAGEVPRRLLYFIVERHRIHNRRAAGRPFPWTDDPLLSTRRFTNIFREADRTSVLIRDILHGHQSDPTFFANMVVHRLVSRPEFNDELGFVKHCSRALRVLDRRKRDGLPIATGAFTSCTSIILRKAQWRAAFEHGEEIWAKITADGTRKPSVKRIYKILMAANCPIPGLGNFLAFQIAADGLLHGVAYLQDWEWAILGPGGKAGLRACGYKMDGDLPCLLRLVNARLPSDVPRLRGIDLEHALCEYSKYVRGGPSLRRFHPVESGQACGPALRWISLDDYGNESRVQPRQVIDLTESADATTAIPRCPEAARSEPFCRRTRSQGRIKEVSECPPTRKRERCAKVLPDGAPEEAMRTLTAISLNEASPFTVRRPSPIRGLGGKENEIPEYPSALKRSRHAKVLPDGVPEEVMRMVAAISWDEIVPSAVPRPPPTERLVGKKNVLPSISTPSTALDAAPGKVMTTVMPLSCGDVAEEAAMTARVLSWDDVVAPAIPTQSSANGLGGKENAFSSIPSKSRSFDFNTDMHGGDVSMGGSPPPPDIIDLTLPTSPEIIDLTLDEVDEALQIVETAGSLPGFLVMNYAKESPVSAPAALDLISGESDQASQVLAGVA